MTALAAAEAYRLWAPSYEAETAISELEQGLAAAMTPPLVGRPLLDAGCGTGRRLRDCGAASAVGIDICPEMLGEGRSNEPLPANVRLSVGDVRDLPLPDAAFDKIWCRLVIGHVADCRRVYAELARVAAPGALVLVTDFHAAAYEAGHRRTFRRDAAVVEVEHHVHSQRDQLEAAAAAGLELEEVREAAIGPQVRHFYESRGRLAQYQEQSGLPVVLALLFRKGPGRCAS